MQDCTITFSLQRLLSVICLHRFSSAESRTSSYIIGNKGSHLRYGEMLEDKLKPINFLILEKFPISESKAITFTP